MASSPIAIGLRKRFDANSDSSNGNEYRAFTTAFDEVVDAAQLAHLPKLSVNEERSFAAATQQFDTLFAGERVAIAASGASLVRDLLQGMSTEERAQTVVSFLIDHSGSMDGLRMMSALLAVEGTVDALHHAGISTEILGHTTTSWKGGKSRRAWRWAGRPSNPGRLCDLRHIVYASADRHLRNTWHLRMALRPGMLHENIDGEALMWAAERLDHALWARRVICLVSDGAPVDDSTLAANEDQTLLARHLEDVEQSLVKEGFVIGALLIGGENFREPSLFERAVEPQEAGIGLLRLILRALLQDPVPARKGAGV
jgi:cobaltochelatase CobT